MLDVTDVREARGRISDVAVHTPLHRSHTFSRRTGADVHLKLETFQRTGAFKIRGATNKIRLLSSAEREAGVVTASAGNHAQGVALAAQQSDVDATVVMPEFAPISKIQATESYGAEVVLHGVDYAEAQTKAHELADERGYTYLHAFDDEDVMAGQGTIGLELVEDLPELDTVVVPIGGGGLIAGIATAVKADLPDARVVGVQAEGAASVPESLRKGKVVERDRVDTIADGIATRRVGELPFEVIREKVDEVVTVDDAEIATAMVDLLERGKALVEGAGAVPMAALLGDNFDYEEGETVVPALCGGNIDLNLLTTVVMRGLVERGRYIRIRTVLKDRPGALDDLLEVISGARANIYAIEHERTSRKLAMNAAEIEIDLETRGPDHAEALLEALRKRGYDVDVLA
jgi:threonine dehydratase